MPHRLYSDSEQNFSRFYCDTKLFTCQTSEGLIKKLEEYLNFQQSKHIALLTDPGVQSTTFFQAIANKTDVVTQLNVGIECELAPMERAVEQCQNNRVDTIIAIGGGSVLDAAKVIRAGYSTNTPLIDLKSEHVLKVDSCQLICIPTTFGTGSEANIYSHIKEPNNKYGLRRSWLSPDAAFICGEPALTLTKQQRYLTGLDAWIHAYECLNLARETSIFNQALLEKALKLHDQYFISYVNEPNTENSLAIAHVSTLAGLGLNNGRTGLIHTLAVAFAKQAPLPHTLSLLPFITAVNKFYGSINIGINIACIEQDKLFLAAEFDALLADAIKQVNIDKLITDCLKDTVLFKETKKTLNTDVMKQLVQQSFLPYLA